MNIPQIPVPELIVGSIAIYTFNYFWGTCMTLQYTVLTTTPQDPSLVISAATLVLILIFYLLLGLYCSLIVLERITRWVFKELKWS